MELAKNSFYDFDYFDWGCAGKLFKSIINETGYKDDLREFENQTLFFK